MRTLGLVVLLAIVAPCNLETSPKPAPPRNLTGIIGAASYEIDVPAGWNGTLLLYSHGYVGSGQLNLALSAPAGIARTWLLDHHFAAAGSAYASTGWAVEDALKDQMALLDFFTKKVGKPKRVIAWGHSMGGLITAGLVQLHPDRFAAAMPICGVVAGGIAIWNSALDAAYAFKTLFAPQSGLELVRITNAEDNFQLYQQIFQTAVKTPQGQARLALVAALVDLPGWFDPREPEPEATDFAGQASAQELWQARIDPSFAFGSRLELEQRAGGNPSWNAGVDYARLLASSTDRAEVKALYAQAGLDLQKDLGVLNAGARIKAEPAAAAYLDRFISPDGNVAVPVLSMHTTGDGLAVPSNESAYAQVVSGSGASAMLRQVFVHRAGHCTLTAAETIAGLQVLLKRLDAGKWDEAALQPGALNKVALAHGTAANQFFGFGFPPAFVSFEPAPFLRPFAFGATIPA